MRQMRAFPRKVAMDTYAGRPAAQWPKSSDRHPASEALQPLAYPPFCMRTMAWHGSGSGVQIGQSGAARPGAGRCKIGRGELGDDARAVEPDVLAAHEPVAELPRRGASET